MFHLFRASLSTVNRFFNERFSSLFLLPSSLPHNSCTNKTNFRSALDRRRRKQVLTRDINLPMKSRSSCTDKITHNKDCRSPCFCLFIITAPCVDIVICSFFFVHHFVSLSFIALERPQKQEKIVSWFMSLCLFVFLPSPQFLFEPRLTLSLLAFKFYVAEDVVVFLLFNFYDL